MRRLFSQDDLIVFVNVSGNLDLMRIHDAAGMRTDIPERTPRISIKSSVSAVCASCCRAVAVTSKNAKDFTATLAVEVTRVSDGASILSGRARSRPHGTSPVVAATVCRG